MNADMNYALDKLKSAFGKLKEAVDRAVDELDRDGVIQRFEFTFELFWKTAKIFLEYEGFEEGRGPRSCIKEGARRGFLTDGETPLDMLEDRNKTSHIYDEDTAKDIFKRIKERYIKAFERNIQMFDEYLSHEKNNQ